MGSGDESPFEMNRTYADPICLSTGHAGACRLQRLFDLLQLLAVLSQGDDAHVYSSAEPRKLRPLAERLARRTELPPVSDFGY